MGTPTKETTLTRFHKGLILYCVSVVARRAEAELISIDIDAECDIGLSFDWEERRVTLQVYGDEDGFDSFTIDLNADSPKSAFVSEPEHVSYQRIANLLVKFVEEDLSLTLEVEPC